MDFTKEHLSAALSELGVLARDQGKIIDISVYGGSCLMLVSNFRVSTKDVDAVAASDQTFIDSAARIVADRRGWPHDWLNDGVRTYLSPAATGQRHHAFFRSYPDEAKPGLRVFVPTAEYMLAMKLMAMRVDVTSEGEDLDDILNLLDVVGLARKEDVVGFAAGFYPEARISAKIMLALDDLWRLHEERTKASAHEPPRYLGRSGAPR
jgi:hypothetical protein